MSREDERRRAAAAEAANGDANEGDSSDEGPLDDAVVQRRRVIQAGVGVGVVLGLGALSALSVTSSLRPPERTSPDRAPPADGDPLVLANDHQHFVVPDDVPLASGLVLAYPQDPDTQVVKAGTLDNLIVLSRFEPDSLDEATRENAAEGIVAYSGVCPHLGCTVTTWNEEREALHCLCHHAYFDPRDAADVITGPSPRALPAIPLKIVAGNLLVAGDFLGPVGPG